jgi:probable phosphoglycerate mutase
MTTVLLVRHGETTWNRDRRVQGWVESALTDRGNEQAAALADAVAGGYDPDRLVVSDLRRTRETAEHLVRATGLSPTFDRDWRERDFGRLQGMAYEELFVDHPQYAVSQSGHWAALERPPGGESLLETRRRVLGAWETLLADAGEDETVVVVSHGGPLYLVLGAVKDLDIVTAIMDQQQDNCALNELHASANPRIVRENDTSFLDD